MEFLALFITGLSVGIVSAFFGIGGGAIMIPVLYALFPNLPPASIISVSLGTIVLNTSLNNWRFYKSGLGPRKKILILILLFSFIGASVGAQVVYMLPEQALKKVFGFILLFMAIRIAFSGGKTEPSKGSENSGPSISITCLLGSFVSSITGLGGGAVFVPLFMSFVKLPLKKVSPYSNVAMTAASFVGLLPHFFKPVTVELKSQIASSSFIGHVNLLFILSLFAGAFISSKWGAKIHDKVEESARRRLLTLLLLILAVKILIQ